MDKSGLKDLLDKKFDEAIVYINAQPPDRFSKRMTKDKWSNGEHLDHLRKTTRAVNKGMKLPKLVLRYKFGINKRKEMSYDDIRHKLEVELYKGPYVAPKKVEPNAITSQDKDRIIKWFLEEKETMKATVDRLSDKHLSKYVLPHPYAGNLTFREFVLFTAFHTDHHIRLMKKYNGMS